MEASANRFSTRLMTSIILLLVIISQSGIDIYLPSMPSMVKVFHVSATAVQLTITTYFLGFALSQLLLGTLADFFGRRPVLIFGLSIFIVGSLSCAISTSIDFLLLSRFIQGFGIGAAGVLSRTLLRDVFEGKHIIRVASYIGMAWTLVPIIAPVIGGYIQHYLGWRYNFGFLILFGISVLVLILFALPETYRDTENFSLKRILTNYKTLLTHRSFIGNVLCILLLWNIFLTLNIMGPFLFQTHLHLSAVAFGWVLVIVSAGYLIGSYINNLLTNYFVPNKVTFVGYMGLLLLEVVFLLIASFSEISLATTLILMCFVLMSTGLIYPNTLANCLLPFPTLAGSASALYGAIVFLSAGISGIPISHITLISQSTIASLWLGFSFVSFIIFLAVNS